MSAFIEIFCRRTEDRRVGRGEVNQTELIHVSTFGEFVGDRSIVLK